MKPDRWYRRRARPVTITAEGSISNPSKAGRIGSGGNYIEPGSRGVLFLLKSGGTEVPKPIGEPGARYLSFRTNGRGADMDRIEFGQAHYGYKTSGFYKFRKTHSATLDLRIPAGSGTTRGAFYLLQLWQGPGLPPIAGIRIKRGTSHTLQFITRSYSGNERKGNVSKEADMITQFELTPGSWHRLNLQYNINPRQPGFFNVNVDGVNIGRFEGKIGSSAKESVIGFSRPPQSYRVKFGIYKQSESAIFNVDYDNISLV